MEHKISQHVSACPRCQLRRTTDRPPPPLLTSMPQCTSLNQRVAIDLMGPLRTSTHGKNYVMCMTDAFTKYAEIVAIPDKSAPVVARVLFEKWICRFGCPVEITSDNGKEFCNQLSKELFSLLQIKHSTTTPYHPQCNSQAEVQNKIIAKYLSSFVDSTTLDWPLYMAPMAFAYNTALHRSIKATPFFLTYGIEPRLPAFPTPDLRRYYGQSDVAEWFATLQHCRQLATHHNIGASDQMQAQFNRNAAPYHYTIDQLVYVDLQNFLGKNRKLSPKWAGPYRITKVFDAGVVQLQLENRQLRVNVARIKPYIPPIPIHADPSTPVIQWDAPIPPPLPVALPPPPPMLQQRAIPPLPPHRLPPLLPAPALPPVLPPPPPAPQPPVNNGPAGPPPMPLPRAPSPARPIVYVPQLLRPLIAQQPVPAPAPVPVTTPALAPTQRVTRSLARAHALPLHPPLSAVHKSSPFIWHQAVSIGPPFVADRFGLPKLRPGCPAPLWLVKQRRHLKRLPQAELNRRLTGDPALRYDPVPYDDSSHFWTPNPHQVQPPQPHIPPHSPDFNLRFLFDESPPPGLHTPDLTDSDSPSPPPPPATPQAPARPRRPPWPNFAELASASRPLDSFLPSGRWLRSFPTSGPSSSAQPSNAASRPRPSASSARTTHTWQQQLGSMLDNAFPPTMQSPPPRLPTLAEAADNVFPPFQLNPASPPQRPQQPSPRRPRGRPPRPKH